MRKAERVRKIQRVGRALAQMEDADASLMLSEYGFPYAGSFDDYGSIYEYMVDRLRQGTDEAIDELDRDLLIGDDVGAASEDDGGPWRAGSFRLFISHTSANRLRAWRMANALARYGVAAFVAHDAIRATKQWEREIVRALRTCDALCAVLTADFPESLWCDQEVGFVLGRGRLVIPLRVETNPYGFIGGVQAVPVRPRARVSEVVDSLLDALLTSDLTSQSISPVIVRRYARSGDGDDARAGLAMIMRIRREAWTPEMVEEVARASTENIQIREAALDGRPLPEISSQLLADLAVRPVPTAPADDDIPF